MRWIERDTSLATLDRSTRQLIGVMQQTMAPGHIVRGSGLSLSQLSRRELHASCTDIFQLIDNAGARGLAGFDFGTLPFAIDVTCGARTAHDFVLQAQPHWRQTMPWLHIELLPAIDGVYILVRDAIGCGQRWPALFEWWCLQWLPTVKRALKQPIAPRLFCSYAQPANWFVYHERLSHDVRFDAPVTAIWLDAQTAFAPFVRTQAVPPVDTTQQIAAGLLAFAHERMRHIEPVSLQALAQSMFVSPATLKRKLQRHDSSFQLLWNQLRTEQALQYLCIEGNSASATAEKLCFSDVSNFRKALRKWSGLSVASFLKALG